LFLFTGKTFSPLLQCRCSLCPEISRSCLSFQPLLSRTYPSLAQPFCERVSVSRVYLCVNPTGDWDWDPLSLLSPSSLTFLHCKIRPGPFSR
jgi:hypothetical protein